MHEEHVSKEPTWAARNFKTEVHIFAHDYTFVELLTANFLCSFYILLYFNSQ